MKEWDLLKLVVHASNNSDHEKLSELILGDDINNHPRVQGAAMIWFELTKENMKKHIDAAKKLAIFEPHESWGFTEDYRHSLLKELLVDLV